MNQTEYTAAFGGPKKIPIEQFVAQDFKDLITPYLLAKADIMIVDSVRLSVGDKQVMFFSEKLD